MVCFVHPLGHCELMGAGSEKLYSKCTLWVWSAALASCLRTGKGSYRRQVCEGKTSLQSIPYGGASREQPQMMGWDEAGKGIPRRGLSEV